MQTNNWPCPNCGSSKVRWRNRRWYDGPLNFIETMFSGATTIRTDAGISAMDRSAMDASFMRDRDISEEQRRMGRHTAELFWKCPDCRMNGEANRADFA